MKKKFMYICLMTGLFSSGIFVNNLNGSDTNNTENTTQDQTEDELSQELKNKFSPIKEKLQDKNLQDLYYSYKNCKDTQEYYKKIEKRGFRVYLNEVRYKEDVK